MFYIMCVHTGPRVICTGAGVCVCVHEISLNVIVSRSCVNELGLYV